MPLFTGIVIETDFSSYPGAIVIVIEFKSYDIIYKPRKINPVFR